jgi:TolB-like protein/DNA-binding winged helix-turn-helix (wHTH) protein
MSRPLTTIYEFNRFKLDKGNQRLTRDGLLLGAPDNTLQLLLFMVEQRGSVVPTQTLIQRFCPGSPFGEEEVATQILSLRRILEDTSKEKPIVRSIPGTGYQFEAEVSETLTDPIANPIADKVTAFEKPEVEYEAAPEPPPPAKTGRTIGIVAAVVVLLALGIFAYLKMGGGSKTSSQIAVLPFHSLTGAPDDDQFDNGLTGALIGDLEKGGQIQVSPADAVQRYVKSGAADPIAAGRELGVKVIIIGLAQRLAGKVRVNVQMISTQDGHQVWTGGFDGDASDVAGIALQISQKISQQIPTTSDNPEQQ